MKRRTFKRVTVAMDRDTLSEAVYVNGRFHSCDQTIYAGELATITNGKPFVLFHRNVAALEGTDWPKSESKLIDFVEE